ncbi:MAG: response regulator transcription factor [Rubrobacteraceae bacterium]
MAERDAGRISAGSPDTTEMLSADVDVQARSVPGPPEVHLTDVKVSAETEDARSPSRGDGLLTARQIEVLKLMARGWTNPRIADEMILSTGTVRTHVQRIIQRLGVSDRTGAVVKAIELGLIRPAKAQD